MGRASKGSKLHADNRAAWTKKIREKLDIKRTFRGETRSI
jgi:hypothetical protein